MNATRKYMEMSDYEHEHETCTQNQNQRWKDCHISFISKLHCDIMQSTMFTDVKFYWYYAEIEQFI